MLFSRAARAMQAQPAVAAVPPSLLERLGALSACTVAEAQDQANIFSHAIRNVVRGTKVCGPAFPVQMPGGDNLALHLALRDAPEGSVLVAHTGGDMAVFGEIMATYAQRRGLAGLLTDGHVRDRADLEQIGLPVFSAGLSMKGAAKEHEGRRGVSVVIGGVLVMPGDIILGDDDGVVLVQPDRLEAVVEAAEARRQREVAILEAIEGGASTIEAMGLSEGPQLDASWSS